MAESLRGFSRHRPETGEPGAGRPGLFPVDATREAAARAGCVVLFKGPDTVIADASGACSVSSCRLWAGRALAGHGGVGGRFGGDDRGADGAGTARHLTAAEAAAWLHVEAARSFGPGLIAEDLPEALPGVLRALGA
jgi:ADP-dependent NAD(P)H-hydrate dehydratase / NAD(P)H-hydrate epimerase